jgi:hypothetical protein
MNKNMEDFKLQIKTEHNTVDATISWESDSAEAIRTFMHMLAIAGYNYDGVRDSIIEIADEIRVERVKEVNNNLPDITTPNPFGGAIVVPYVGPTSGTITSPCGTSITTTTNNSGE